MSIASVLPYQELLGNYNIGKSFVVRIPVLPYQELLGNYNTSAAANDTGRCFTIPRTARELQQPCNRLLQASGIYHTKNCAGYYDKVLVPQSSDAPFLRGVIFLYRKILI